MNFNSKQEELLKLWADLVNVMRDPEGMAKLMQDANDAVAEMKKYKEEQRKIMDIDDWYRNLCVILDDREDSVMVKEKAYEEKVKKHENMVREKLDSLNKQMDAVSKKHDEYEKKLADVAYVEKEMKLLNEEKVRMGLWEDELNVKDKEMKVKLEQMEKAWGGAK